MGSYAEGREKLTRDQIVALRPFLRCLGVTDEKSWAFIDKDGHRLAAAPPLPLDAFVALHDAFRPHLVFSDVYSDKEPRAGSAAPTRENGP
jgi:hypothetical protein